MWVGGTVGGTVAPGDAVGRVLSCHQLLYPRWDWQKGLSVWSLHVLPVSPRVDTLTKTCSNPGLYNASPWPAGAPDGGEWNWLE